MTAEASASFWSQLPNQLFAALHSSPDGIDTASLTERLKIAGPNVIREDNASGLAALLVKQFTSPLVLILLFGAFVSLALHDATDAIIIFVIVCGSALLSFWQEARASRAIAALRSQLALTTRVVRGGVEAIIPASELVPGDIVLLSAGNLVPADGLILDATDFLVTEAALTGESFPVEKRPGSVAPNATISSRTNAVFAGSSVRSGAARVLIARTGRQTEFGGIAARLGDSQPETDFARGVRRFGDMLLKVMFAIVLFVLAANQLLGRPFVESMLFAVALAVGLSPELLPAIVTVTLSTGATHLSKRGVIVRKLEALENFGSMDVLCTDKTGTITTGKVVLANATDPTGQPSSTVKRAAFLNAALETGIANPLDGALVAMGEADKLSTAGIIKVDEIPYDFQRRRLTIVYEDAGSRQLVTKGAFAEVLGVCTAVAKGNAAAPLTDTTRAELETFFEAQGENGFRVLALATKRVDPKADYTRDDEKELTFAGFLLFVDPPKGTAAEALSNLKRAGIATKVISGDNRHVAAHVARSVGLDPEAMLTGKEVARMTDEALWHRAPRTDLFVEIEPQQKERIVRALQKAGHAVGYLGDGINDAPALHAADIGISVDGAVDVARESADIVLLKPDLGVLCKGVEDGRRTFANTLKYISISISSNFGNMISMALATPLLPFLPMLPKQILLNNLLADLPALAISTDEVDPEQGKKPQRWDIVFVRRFMILFGIAGSIFDLITFGVLLFLLKADPVLFRAGWFTTSLLSQIAIVMVLRTRRRPWLSRPSIALLGATALVCGAVLAMPYFGPLAAVFEFRPFGLKEICVFLAIVVGYLAATETLKHLFYARLAGRLGHRPVKRVRGPGSSTRMRYNGPA